MPPGFSEEQAKHIGERMDMVADFSEALGLPHKETLSEEEMDKERQMWTNELLSQGLIDPAFAYALTLVDFIPRLLSRFLMEGRDDVSLSLCAGCKIVSSLCIPYVFFLQRLHRQCIARDRVKTLTGRPIRIYVVK
jgi:hypothetical protein